MKREGNRSGSAPARKRRRYVRFTRWRRGRFFFELGRGGNVQVAAELAGVGIDCIYRLRRVEPGFTERMDAAREEADAALERAEAELEDAEEAGGGVGEGLVIRRGVGGRLRVMAAGTRWWTERDDAVFLGHLRATGNVSASARAAGFTPKSARNRRDRLPSFQLAWDRAMEDAEIMLEHRLLIEAAEGTPAMYPGAFEAAEPGKFDPWLALWILKYRDGRREGRIRTRRRRDPSSGEEAAKEVLRRIEVMKRYEKRFGGG